MEKKTENNFYVLLYFIIFCFGFGYEFLIVKYIEKLNEFSFKEWINKKFDIKFKKFRVKTENELDDINNNNIKELQRCLI